MKLKKIALFIVTLFIAIAIAGDETQITVKTTGKASPDIRQSAQARAMALRAAKVEGYKKLAEAAGLSVKKQQGKRTRTHVDATLKHARVISTQYKNDYEVEVVMQIEKKHIQQTQKTRLKKEIKRIEAQLINLNRRLKKLKKMDKEISKKITKKMTNRDD
ncbi:MAG: hypothetical protein GY757_00265 [bacterium]|nr:hypothetical protein [bacterium]